MMRTTENRILVAGRTDAGRILCSPRRRDGIGYLVSIGGAEEPPPAGYRNISNRLRLVFEDELTVQLGGPSAEDVERIIKFARGVDLVGARALFQCQAGISRSSAAAVILLRTIEPHATGPELAAYVRRACPAANPNREMLRLADSVFGGSELQQAWSCERP